MRRSCRRSYAVNPGAARSHNGGWCRGIAMSFSLLKPHPIFVIAVVVAAILRIAYERKRRNL